MVAKMDDGEIDNSDDGMLQNPGSSSNYQNSAAGEPFLDELLKNTQTCTHTHTCNPPGPDSAHTHTCFHTHTQVLTSEDDGHHSNKKHPNLKPKRPPGNREAVRKYREKKKARTAYLEEEVKKVHLLNQQLVKKLQREAALEAEVVRLRSVLINLRGQIDAELGALRGGDCRMDSAAGIELQCQADLPCLHPHTGSSSQGSVGGSVKVLTVPWDGNCHTGHIPDCPSTRNDKLRAHVDTLVSSASKPQ